MGRSTKPGASRGITETKRSYMKRRCSFPKCRKRAMDLMDGEYLCRIHSPVREGYKNKLRIKHNGNTTE